MMYWALCGVWSRGEGAQRCRAEWTSGGDGEQHQEVLRGAGAAAGSQGRAGLWEGGEKQFHLSAHRRTKPAEGATRTPEEEEEAERWRRDVAGPRWENTGISQCLHSYTQLACVINIFTSFFPCISCCICHVVLLQTALSWNLLLCLCSHFLPPQRFSMEGLSSVIQNSFRQTFGSGCSERQVTSLFCLFTCLLSDGNSIPQKHSLYLSCLPSHST